MYACPHSSIPSLYSCLSSTTMCGPNQNIILFFRHSSDGVWSRPNPLTNPRSCGSCGLSCFFFFRSVLCVWSPEYALPFPLVPAILFPFAFIVAAAMPGFTPRSWELPQGREHGWHSPGPGRAPAGTTGSLATEGVYGRTATQQSARQGGY